LKGEGQSLLTKYNYRPLLYIRNYKIENDNSFREIHFFRAIVNEFLTFNNYKRLQNLEFKIEINFNMKKMKINCKTLVITTGLLITLFGCSKKLDRYEDPKWLGGANIETLEKGGNYTIFLRLMEKAHYKNTLQKQLATLFVPDDDAFRKYLQEKGLDSIGQLSDDQALELFTLHFLSNPVNANHLVYEKQWKRLESAIGEYRSLFFRRSTQSLPAPYIEIPKYDPQYKNQQLFISTDVKFVPLFSKLYFQDYNGNGDIDYPFMYPASDWGGMLQWHSARIIPRKGKENVTDIEDLCNPTASGFIYYIDRVVDAMPNVEQYLIANQTNYSLFYDLMQRFATYPSAGNDNQGRALYNKGYSGISNLAAEKGPNAASTQSPAWLLDIFTVFLPDNTTLQNYLDTTVLKTYANLSEVPRITIQYILQSQITNRLELKSKFIKEFINVYGDRSVINASDVAPGFMCSNGVVYKSSRILEPNIFLCVPGQLFINKNYSDFLTMLTNTNLITSLSGDKDVTLFAPTNDELNAANIRLFLNSSGVLEFQEKSDQEEWVVITDDNLVSYAQDHIYYGKLTDLSRERYIEMASHNFVHYSSNVLTAGLNIKNNTPASIVGAKTCKNGMLYYIDKPILTKYRMGQYIMNDDNLSEFGKLMVKVNMINLDYMDPDNRNYYPDMSITEEANQYYWTAFIPDNAAVSAGIANGSIPDTAVSADPAKLAALKSFVDYHFIRKTIFDDGVESGLFATLYTGASLNITNNINNLQITDATGQVVVLNHADADNIVRKGVVHKITSVLKYK
jgi:uncharacterized surface protein with fasciclin (FAS1) repeats